MQQQQQQQQPNKKKIYRLCQNIVHNNNSWDQLFTLGNDLFQLLRDQDFKLFDLKGQQYMQILKCIDTLDKCMRNAENTTDIFNAAQSLSWILASDWDEEEGDE